MKNKGVFQRVYLSATYVTMACLAFSQQQVNISGQVLDSLTQKPLSFALVYVTPDTGASYLAYDQTGDDGGFELSLASSGANLLLHARFLGYEEKILPVNSAQNGRLTIFLSPKSSLLKEVVVTQARPPITHQTDTTVYDVKAFVDSTEYNVEDVLKKLPGIEVKSDGQIAVNGKAVERVLIEGSDMFGRRYTIGTKNIRAGYLDKVEVIDHYQENPVLSHVNTSEAVVLNLKLKPDKKNVLNGTYDVGTGIGADKSLKGLANVNVFSISKKIKTLFISSNGNTGMSTGAEEMQSAYDNPSESDVKASVLQIPDFQRVMAIGNPGLPAEFVDPSTRLFSTLRTSYQFNDRWEINANATFFQQRGQQFSFNEQVFFLNSDLYQLNTAQQINLQNILSGADVYIRHFNSDNSRSLQLFGRWDINRMNNRTFIEEFRADFYNKYSITDGQRQRDGAATALFTQKTGEKSALQLQIKTAHVILPQTLMAVNNDFPFFWNVDTTLVSLSQQLQWRHGETEFLARYTWAARYFILEVEPLYALSNSVFENAVQLASQGNDNYLPLFSGVEQPQRVDIRRAGVNLHLNGQLSAATSWGLSLQGRHMKAQYATSSGFSLPTATIRAFVNKKFKKDAEGRLSYVYQEQTLPAHYFISIPYLFDSYSISEQDIRTSNHAGHLLALHYGVRNAFKLRSWHVGLRYHFGQHLWRNADRFEQSLAVATPFFSRNNERLVCNGYWDQFIPALKSNIRFHATYSHAMGAYAVSGSVFNLGTQTGQIGGSAAIAPLSFLKFIVDNSWSIYSTYSPGAGEANRINAWRSALTCMFMHNNWQISGSWNGAFTEDNRGGTARLQGYQLRAQKRFIVNRKPMMLGLRIVNVPNIDEFSLLQNSDYFVFRSAVQAVPAFALINVDYSF